MKIALVGVTSSISRALISLFKNKAEIVTLGRKNADIIVDLSNHLEQVILEKDSNIQGDGGS